MYRSLLARAARDKALGATARNVRDGLDRTKLDALLLHHLEETAAVRLLTHDTAAAREHCVLERALRAIRQWAGQQLPRQLDNGVS